MSETFDPEGSWNRDGNLVYSITEDGFRKGGKLGYRNRIAINVVFDRNVSEEEREHVIQMLMHFAPQLDAVKVFS